jgi:hypothetical protein
MRDLDPLGPVQIEGSGDIASHDVLRLTLGHPKRPQDPQLLLQGLALIAAGEMARIGPERIRSGPTASSVRWKSSFRSMG